MRSSRTILRSVDVYNTLLARSQKASGRIWWYFVMFATGCTLYVSTFTTPTLYRTTVVVVMIFVVCFAGGLLGMLLALMDKRMAEKGLYEFFAEEEEEPPTETEAERVAREAKEKQDWIDLMSAKHGPPKGRLWSVDENIIKVGKYELSHADWRILYFALHDNTWYWNKANVTKAKRADGSLVIPNLTGAAYGELEKEFRHLGFFVGRSRKINDHGRRTLREAANLLPGNRQ